MKKQFIFFASLIIGLIFAVGIFFVMYRIALPLEQFIYVAF